MVGQFISKVQSYGCRIYIDDFGAGYSNFERLFKLNIDVLKIDGSIIKDIDKAKDLQTITRTIIALAKHSNMKVVAEFVHSKEVDDIVRELLVKFYYTKLIGTFIDYCAETNKYLNFFDCFLCLSFI